MATMDENGNFVFPTDQATLYVPGAGNASSDFIGFSFNGITHTDMGISRVSEGSRYSEQMLPNFQDKSAQMPGSDYTLYWESFYSTKTWTLQIAFDNMTDYQMSLLRTTLNTKQMGNLTFNEKVYYMPTSDQTYSNSKQYYTLNNHNYYYFNGNSFAQGTTYYEAYPIHWLAKVQSPPQLKYICFDEDGTRVYKGEGTITFISYYPFGMSELQTKSNISSISVVNIGDMPMDWYVIIANSNTSNLGELKIEVNGVAINKLIFNGFTVKTGDTHIMVNSKTNLVEGLKFANNVYTQTGNVYNNYISQGDFFKIPVGTSNFFIVPHQATANYTCDLYYRFLYL